MNSNTLSDMTRYQHNMTLATAQGHAYAMAYPCGGATKAAAARLALQTPYLTLK